MCVVSIVDSISATSMPVNEFVIYRSIHKFDMKQILIVCDTKMPENVVIPEDIEVCMVGNDRKKIRTLVKTIEKKYEKKAVYHMHHQKSAMLFLASTVFLGTRSRSLYTVHSTFSGRDIKYRISSCICVLAAKRANCVSKAAFSEYNSVVKKLKGSRFTAIPNGVDVDRIDETVGANPAKASRKTLICVGRMIPLKNHKFLIALMKKLPEHRLVLVGAEDKEGKIRKLAQSEGVFDRVEFKGLIPREKVFEELSKAEIYVSPSFVEGLPVSVLEAMRVGLLPIISDIAPHREIGEHCNSVRVLPLIEDLWVDCIKEIERFDDCKVENESKQIKEFVKEEFSLEKMHEQYLSVYRKLI